MTQKMPIDLKALKREARHQVTAPRRLLELATLTPQLSRAVAGSTNAPLPVLEQLVRNGDMPTRRAVAANPRATAALLAHLSQDQQWTVLKAVAVHPQTDVPTLQRLSIHPRDTVKIALLDRPNLPAKLLKTLSRDPDFRVRWKVAGYAALSSSLLQQLFADENMMVRAEVVEHIASPVAQKRQALDDPEAWVRTAALRALAALTPQMGAVTEAELWHAARDPDETVRLRVAEVLADKYAEIQKFLPDHVAQSIADTLFRDAVDDVRLVAAWRADAALLPELLPLLGQELATVGSTAVARVLLERCVDPAVTALLLEHGDSWLLGCMAESALDPAAHTALLENPEHCGDLPGNPHISDAFWIAAGERVLADPASNPHLLPLIREVLMDTQNSSRPELFRWLAAHVDTLLTISRHFDEEK